MRRKRQSDQERSMSCVSDECRQGRDACPTPLVCHQPARPMSTPMRRLVDIATGAIIAAVIALTIGALGELLDAHDAQQHAATAIARAAADDRDADLRQCQAVHGENPSAVQLPDGSHRCVDKRGRRLNAATTVAAREGAR
jgi:hypothetical protein